MNKYFLIIFFSIMAVFMVILQVGIYHGKKAPGKETSKNSQSYTPLAEQIKKNNQEFAKAEALIQRLGVNNEFERMVDVPAGDFFMGISSSGPISTGRKVYLPLFKIDKYEVTFAQFYKFVELTGHRKPRLAGYLSVDSEGLPLLMNPYNPVVGVSWDDAREYCEWKKKRLPTEAEWEKAAKGSGSNLWPWGNDANPLYGNFVGKEDGFPYTAPVGSFTKDRSAYGVMDMAGNA
ncbi:MAG TPA: formylglycine-generating enzyme family protein, partial [Nitrospiria bacterium]|nr:formylglycine-generating enzyme family protein [Nitrospiria bacterium]